MRHFPKRFAILVGFIFATSTSFSINAKPFGDPELGKIKTPSCGFCHGTTGVTNNPSYPHIAGQNAQYLFQSMKAYKNGERTGAMASMMGAQLQHLNDEDLRDIAAYYAAQEAVQN